MTSVINIYEYLTFFSRLVGMEFMKKYIHVARVIKPVLSREAANCIAEEYAKLRCQDQESTDIARVRFINIAFRILASSFY